MKLLFTPALVFAFIFYFSGCVITPVNSGPSKTTLYLLGLTVSSGVWNFDEGYVNGILEKLIAEGEIFAGVVTSGDNLFTLKSRDKKQSYNDLEALVAQKKLRFQVIKLTSRESGAEVGELKLYY